MGRGCNASRLEVVQDLREALRITEPHARIQQAVCKHLIGCDAGTPDQLQDPVDVLKACRVLDALHQDGAGEGVRAHALLLHLTHDPPGKPHVLPCHSVLDQGVVRHCVGPELPPLHLAQRLLGLRVRALGEEQLKVGVVGDHIDIAAGLHPPEQALGGSAVAASSAGLESAVVGRCISRERRALELIEEPERTLDVALAARRADQRHVIQQVWVARLLEELPCELMPAALHRTLDDATKGHGIGLHTVSPHVRVQVADLVPEPRVGVDLYER
mmetsp:Transcript_76594/g.203401  ORF Transcript_76594/g.203401 Transcript_76594/m.203401 type:complete len:273 (+) Transcript_76594:1302-2120(+)